MTDGLRRRRLAVVVSGRGRNLGALHQACADGRINADIVAVISSRAEAAALEHARNAGVHALAIPHDGFADRTAFDAVLAAALDQVDPDIIALAGFMRVLGTDFIERFKGRLLNIHPSLLPKYPGLHTHRRALEAGDREHGASVHFVTPQLDGGPCIIQGALSVRAEDDEQSLANRVLEMIELKIYPQAIAWMARGELALTGETVVWRGQALRCPLGVSDLDEAFR